MILNGYLNIPPTETDEMVFTVTVKRILIESGVAESVMSNIEEIIYNVVHIRLHDGDEDLQRDYFEKKGRYTDDLSELGLEEMSVDGYRWPPAIQHTWTLYEACLESSDGNEKWRIRQDGLVWK